MYIANIGAQKPGGMGLLASTYLPTKQAVEKLPHVSTHDSMIIESKVMAH